MCKWIFHFLSVSDCTNHFVKFGVQLSLKINNIHTKFHNKNLQNINLHIGLIRANKDSIHLRLLCHGVVSYQPVSVAKRD